VDNGKSKQEKHDFEGAIKDYGKAIEIDPTFSDAYYLRASLFYDHERYKEAITDLNQLISLKPEPIEFHMAALILRGENNLKINNKENACLDFIEARQLGASVDEKYLKFCGHQEKKKEKISVKLPDPENWEITDQGIKNNQLTTLIAHTKKPSEYLSLASLDKKGIDLIKAMNDVYKTTKSKSKGAELNFIEKDLNTKEPWIMYEIQNVDYEECHCKVSQIWYLTQGENFFHSCFMSVRSDTFTEEKKEEMIRVFKTAKIIYQ
jgi:hypothetical protein